MKKKKDYMKKQAAHHYQQKSWKMREPPASSKKPWRPFWRSAKPPDVSKRRNPRRKPPWDTARVKNLRKDIPFVPQRNEVGDLFSMSWFSFSKFPERKSKLSLVSHFNSSSFS